MLYIKLRAMMLHPCIQELITGFLETTDLPLCSKAWKPDVDLKSRCGWTVWLLESVEKVSFHLPDPKAAQGFAE